jgi:hypothetical protein
MVGRGASDCIKKTIQKIVKIGHNMNHQDRSVFTEEENMSGIVCAMRAQKRITMAGGAA